MNKKGDISWGVIVSAIIAVVVLVVLMLIFREQISEVAKGFMNIIKGTTSSTEELNLSKMVG